MQWQNYKIPDLVLGTAQLGFDYGIANRTGRPNFDEALAIVRTAAQSGFDWFDTAQAYGESEAVLGKIFRQLKIQPKVITKLEPNLNFGDAQVIYDAVASSCKALAVERLWGVMLHREEWLDAWENGLADGLLRARQSGLVEYFGVSVADRQEFLRANEHAQIDLIQFPFNAWDSRFLDVPKTKCLFARSVYLQGLLLMPSAEVARRLPQAHDISLSWHALCDAMGMKPKQLAVRYAKTSGASLVIGAETRSQLLENVALITEPALDGNALKMVQNRLHSFAKKDFVNPAMWSVR